MKERISVNDTNKKYITDGYPDEETANYTPLVFLSETDRLTFEQIRDVCQHLRLDEQESLLRYFVAETALDAIAHAINSDFVRSMPQGRKVKIWEKYEAHSNDLQKKTDDIVRALEKYAPKTTKNATPP